MSVEIELVGGPADGRRVVVEGDPMDPPLVHEVFQARSGNVWATGKQGQPTGAGMAKHVYRREVNAGDSGPLWRYLYART